MTDTGQIPAEGLPENAGMVEQPGVPAHGAYTYLSETTAEDEDLLLLPGAQGAWGNEVPPPAPEPVFEAVHQPAPQEQPAPEQPAYEGVAYEAAAPEPAPHEAAVPEAAVQDPGPPEAVVPEPGQHETAVHEPGPHETAGRDSGSVDLGAVRHPAPPPPAPVPPRRPLHLGPPLPDTSASPVRSLADRGPAGAPVRQMGPPTTGPEYFDAPQLRDLPPQGAAPWGAQAPVSAGVPTAETVVPVGKPDGEVAGESLGGGIAMALDTGVVVPEPEPVMGAGTGKDPDLAQAPDAGGAWQGHGQMFAGEPATPFAHVSTESSGNAGVPEAGQLPQGAEELAAGQVPEQAQAQVYEQGAEPEFVPGVAEQGVDAGYAPHGDGVAEGVVAPVAEEAFAPGTGSVPGAEGAYVVHPGPVPEDAVAVTDGGQVPEPEQAEIGRAHV